MLDLNKDPNKRVHIPSRFKEYALLQERERQYNLKRLCHQKVTQKNN